MDATIITIRRKDGRKFANCKYELESSPFESDVHAKQWAAAFTDCEIVGIRNVEVNPSRVIRKHEMECVRD